MDAIISKPSIESRPQRISKDRAIACLMRTDEAKRLNQEFHSINIKNKPKLTKMKKASAKKTCTPRKPSKHQTNDSDQNNTDSDDDFLSSSSSFGTDSDEADFIPSRTPKAVSKLHRKFSTMSIASPGSNVPKRQTLPVDELDEISSAKKNLHVAAVPDTLPCRDSEFKHIYCFIEMKLFTRTSGCMYISGLPGTGKTATVHEVIDNIKSRSDLPVFRFVEVNGMRVTCPKQIFVDIYFELYGSRVTPNHAVELLHKEFGHRGGVQYSPCVLLVDELDLLWTNKQDVLYQLFDWPQRCNNLIVLSIANTMDLPERMLHQRVSSRMGFTRLTFQPYTHSQLTTIVKSRLHDAAIFEETAVELCAKKVAAVSGDARRALDICRRAVELASEMEFQETAKTRSGGSRMVPVEMDEEEKQHVHLVTIDHVDQAIKEMFSNTKLAAIRSRSVYERLFLRAIVQEFQRSGVEEARVDRVMLRLGEICGIEGFPMVNEQVVFRMIMSLGSYKLILAEPTRYGIKTMIRLNFTQQDLHLALKDASYEID